MKLKNLINQYIHQSKVMQLATVYNGMPQLCTVHYAVDEEGNFYWFSSRLAHHSQAIHAFPHVAIGVLHNVELRQCVHSQGKAYLATGDDVLKAHECYSERFGENPKNLEQALSHDEKKLAYYVYRPVQMVLFDAANFPENPRQELRL